MTLEWIDIFILLGLSQGILFSLALLFGKLFNDKTNRFLAYSILLIIIMGLNDWACKKGLDEQYYFIDFLGDDVPWILLFYVPIFVFILKSVQHKMANSNKLWLLTLPFMIFLFLNVLIDLDMDFNLIKADSLVRNRGIIYSIEYYLAMVFTIIQSLACYFLIVKSQIPRDKKQWLKYTWVFTLLLLVIWFILIFIPVLNQNRMMDHLLWTGVSFFIYWLIYKGLYRFNLAGDKEAIHRILNKPSYISEISEIVPKKSPNKISDKENIYMEKLEHLMTHKYIFRNPDLGLNDVGNMMELSPGYLSQIINTSLGQSFTSYINSYRVNEVKKLLIDEKFSHYSILAIGLECGFKSKSAFYNTFKKSTGCTPSQFKAKHKS